MQNSMQYTFHLFGPRAGQTAVINGHKFVNGIYRVVLSPVQVVPLMKVLGAYGAYAVGTADYEKAVKEAEANGADEVSEGSRSGDPEEVPGAGGSDGSGPAEAEADDGAGAVTAEGVSEGHDSTGDGHEHARIPKFEESADQPEPSEPEAVGSDEVATAMMKLDPSNDDHWVMTGAHKGKPKLLAVEEAYGRSGLTRQDLEAALPGWDRDKALEAALEG